MNDRAKRYAPGVAHWLTFSDPRLEPTQDTAAVRAVLEAVHSPELAATRTQMLELLDTRPDPLNRTERPGHFTGSALVVDEQRERLLVLFHTKLQIWVQPGGHADGDANLAHVALREATEETGMSGLAVWSSVVDLDIHEVRPPAEDPHLHHDVRFLVVAGPDSVLDPNEESQAHRWVDERELAQFGADAGLLRLARQAMVLAGELPEVGPRR